MLRTEMKVFLLIGGRGWNFLSHWAICRWFFASLTDSSTSIWLEKTSVFTLKNYVRPSRILHFLLQLFRDHCQVLAVFVCYTCWLEKLCQTLLTHDQSTFSIFGCNCYLTEVHVHSTGAVSKLSDVICSRFFFIHNCLRDKYLFLSTLTIGVLHTCDLLYVPPPFWNINMLWFDTTPIVISHICVVVSRREMSMPICSTVQLFIAKEWICCTNVY